MIYTTTTNHMTPYEKHFTNLDRTRRAKVTFIDGSSAMAQGTGDIRVLTREGKKKTIKNVLYVPGIVANALALMLTWIWIKPGGRKTEVFACVYRLIEYHLRVVNRIRIYFWASLNFPSIISP